MIKDKLDNIYEEKLSVKELIPGFLEFNQEFNLIGED